MIRRLKQIQCTFVGITIAGLVTQAHALDPTRQISQYVREQWTTESRFPGGAVNGIAQTADGYLWIGTDRGLIRFDGFTFKPVSSGSITNASNDSILQLLSDTNGSLWIRPQGAYLLRQRNGEFEGVRYGLPAITAISRDNHGGVLVSDVEQGTFRLVTDNVQKLGPSLPPVISMAETDNDTIWLGTLGDGLFSLTRGQATNVNAGLPDRKINCLLPAGSDELWVGTDTGLYRGNGNGFQRVDLPSSLQSIQVLSILRDRDSNIWVGTTRGLLRINGKEISFSEEKELRGGGGINALFEDREGNLWVGGASGLGRIRDSPFVTYSSVNDPRFDHIGPVYVDPAGRVWFAPAQGGLYVFQNGRVEAITSIRTRDVVYSITGKSDDVWAGLQRGGLVHFRFRSRLTSVHHYTTANGLAQDSVYAVYESRDGSLWAGTLNAGVSKFKDGRFTTYTTTDGLASNTIFSILEARDGTLWFATPNGLSSLENGRWRHYGTVDGLPSPEVTCVFEDTSGNLWAGTTAGLASFAYDHFQAIHESPDILHETIVGIAEDKNERFWVATSGHVLRVPRAKLRSGVVKAIDVREYDHADGLESTKGVNRSRSVVPDSAGRIWFSLNSGLSVVDPSQITENPVPALPHIEAISADDDPSNLADSGRVPPLPRRITVEYTGLSLAMPERVRFRYRLENFDSDWSRPVAAREAVYTNLGPGSYRFRLVACNSEGQWNGPETSISFKVTAAYYQTYWFRMLCIVLFIALLCALYQMRVQQLQQQERKFREAVETMPALAFVADAEGNRTFLNRGWLEYTGLSPTEASGSGWEKAVHPDDRNRVLERWRTSQKTGQHLDYEVRLRRGSDGAYRWFQARAKPLRDRRGKIVKWCAVANDIEDRKRAEQLQADLTHASRLSTMGELVASISHELAQPITVTAAHAKASLRWLRRDPPELAEVLQGTEKIVEASALASEIINRLRSLYKKAPPKRELVAMNEVIGEMTGMLRSEARRHGVSVRTDLKDDLPMTLADRVQLQQILMNLMLNGIEAMKNTGGVLTVKSQLAEDGQIEISVDDTGLGVPADKVDQIFDAFFTTKPEGSGMGLAICKSIVESHGGRIWTDDNGRRGASFHFTLNVALAETTSRMDAS